MAQPTDVSRITVRDTNLIAFCRNADAATNIAADIAQKGLGHAPVVRDGNYAKIEIKLQTGVSANAYFDILGLDEATRGATSPFLNSALAKVNAVANANFSGVTHDAGAAHLEAAALVTRLQARTQDGATRVI